MIIQDAKQEFLWWQKKRLSYTRSGYGRRIPTSYKIKVNNRWLRVYCCIYSNSGTLYVKKFTAENIIQDYQIEEALK